MARLTAAKRRALPRSDYAVPSKAPGPGSFPIPDRAHAIAAKRLEHNAPASERPAIERKANRMLGKSKPKANPNHESYAYDWRKQ